VRFGLPVTKSKLAVVAGVAIAGVVCSSVNSFAVVPTGPASLTPASGTPHLIDTGTMEYVRQLVPCGGTMYAVGTFTQIGVGASTVYNRNNVFSFSDTKPYTMTSFDPNVNGTVNSIAFNGTDCSHAYIGGKFTSVGGTAVKNIAEVDTTTGAVVPGFKASAAGQVFTLLGDNGHIFAGGTFTSINGSSAAPYFASLNPTTGRDDGYLRLNISGAYIYNDAAGHPAAEAPTRVHNEMLSHDGTKLLVEGVFTTIGGQPRRQVAVLDLGATTATTDAWHATELDANCASVEPFYAKDASWSADDQTIFVATTGYKPASGPGYSTHDPRAGLCDAAVAFPATSGDVTHSWINYTGCDSLYATVADGSTAYFGGHERWASNPNGCVRMTWSSTAACGSPATTRATSTCVRPSSTWPASASCPTRRASTSADAQCGATPLVVNGLETQRDGALADPEVDDRTGLHHPVTWLSDVN
jgi:hypothetical protein